MPRKCVYSTNKSGQCQSIGFGNPPLCTKHVKHRKKVIEQAKAEQDSMLSTALGILLSNPTVGGIFNKVNGLIDQAGGVISQVAAGDLSMFQNLGKKPAQPPPATQSPNLEAAREILGFKLDDVLTVTKIKDRKKELAKVFHPDKGWDEKMMQRINMAAEILIKEIS